MATPPPPPPPLGPDALRWHGLLATAGWAAPRIAARSEAEARPGYEAYDASEYLDQPQVLKDLEDLAP